MRPPLGRRREPKWWHMDEWGWAIYAVFFVVILVGAIWLRVAAPCEWLGWVPVKDMPGRCVDWVRP